MATLITAFVVGLIVALMADKKEKAQVTITDADVMHPAEFEMRDHYYMRCSE
jgi:uncharacterized membrane protein YraQ (UPF0718 family)